MKKNIAFLLSESTAYGLPRIFKTERLHLKIFWLIFFILGSLASGWYIWDAVMSYLDYEIITKIESVYEQPMPFPTVSICPFYGGNVFNTSLNDIIDICIFHLDNSCQTYPDNYFERIYTESGYCLRFNSGKNVSGHTIQFQNSTIGGKDDSLFLKFKLNISLIIWIHDALSPPKNSFHNYNGNYILVSPFTMTHLIVNKVVEEKLGLPYNHCYKDVNTFPLNKTIIDYILSQNIAYKQTNCLELCFDVYYLNENPCNCTNTTLGNVFIECHKTFDNYNTSGCTFKNRINFFKQKVVDKCQQYCPLECDTLLYTVQDNVMIGLNYSSLSIHYESLKYTKISQIPKEKEFDLISSIGGLFGLFIGVSFVTLFEIAELFIEILFNFYSNKKIRKKITDKNDVVLTIINNKI